MKAADIPDADMLREVLRYQKGIGTSLYSLELAFPAFPAKVVKAKLHALLRRKLLTGCCCGCRGDFNLTQKAMDAL